MKFGWGRGSGAWGIGLLLLAPLGCEKAAERHDPSVEVGIFYGGQVQRLGKVDVSRVDPPKLGFRIHPPQQGFEGGVVHYEIVRPGPAGRRVTQRGNLKVPQSRERLDHLIEVSPQAKLGLWNIRIAYGDRLLADRALYLTPAR